MPADQPSTRLHVVTGKGGAGKSTVAAALALALAGPGKRVLLCEVEGRQGISRLFAGAPLGVTEAALTHGLTPGPGAGLGQPGGEVFALHIDPEAALREYLATYLHVGPAVRALEAFGMVEFATSIAPGLRDVLLTGKVYEATKPTRRGKGALTYDAVVLDAPPTGRVTRFLTANAELAGLARMGPIKNQADSVMATLRGPQTAIHLVTLLEDMVVQETVDAVSELRSAELPVRSVVINRARPQLLEDELANSVAAGAVRPQDVATTLSRAFSISPGSRGSARPPDLGFVDTLLRWGTQHTERRRLENVERDRLYALGLDLTELPAHPGPVDPTTLRDFARDLSQSRIAR